VGLGTPLGLRILDAAQDVPTSASAALTISP
jgi:hypothetical protein